MTKRLTCKAQGMTGKKLGGKGYPGLEHAFVLSPVGLRALGSMLKYLLLPLSMSDFCHFVGIHEMTGLHLSASLMDDG